MESSGGDAADVYCELLLRDSDATRAVWPHAFALRLRVTLSAAGALRMDARVDNTGAEALSFTFALHTYFRVADVTRAAVRGLRGADYLDSLQARARLTEAGDTITFDKEVRSRAPHDASRTHARSHPPAAAAQVDRIYLAVPPAVQLADGAASRLFTVATRNLPDAVVWNPWVAKAASMADFGALSKRNACRTRCALTGPRVRRR